MLHLRIVATLTHVHMVVGVNGFLRAQLASQHLNCTIRNDLQRVRMRNAHKERYPDAPRSRSY